MELEPSNVYVCRIATRNEVGVGAFSFPVHLSTRAEKVLRVQRSTTVPSSRDIQIIVVTKEMSAKLQKPIMNSKCVHILRFFLFILAVLEIVTWAELALNSFSRSVVAGGARGGHGPPCNQICRKLSEKADLVGKVEIFTSNF